MFVLCYLCYSTNTIANWLKKGEDVDNDCGAVRLFLLLKNSSAFCLLPPVCAVGEEQCAVL